MMEVLHRNGLGRIASWTFAGTTTTLPAVLAVNTPRHPAPETAEAVLGGPRDGVLSLSAAGTVLRPRNGGGVRVGPIAGIPLAARDIDSALPAGSPDVAVVRREADLPEARGELVALESAVEYLRDPRSFVRIVEAVRMALGPTRVLFVPGIARPSNLAILAYAGVDVVDDSRVVWEGAHGAFLTADGSLTLEADEPLPCSCAACARPDPEREGHNRRALGQELLVVRNAIRHGVLREHAERRAVNDPWSTAVLRHLDLRHHEFVESYTAVEGAPLRAYSAMSLTRPEVVRFRRRVRDRYGKPASAGVLVILPCSARKPYSRSLSHRAFRAAIRAAGNSAAVHEVVVTSPFGVVPRELESVYPVRAYDVPVTGDWSRDERAMLEQDLSDYLERNRYRAVVGHVEAEADAVVSAHRDTAITCDGSPASAASLESLTETLRGLLADAPPVAWSVRAVEEVAGLARFQFGPGGETLLDGGTLKGRWPRFRIVRDGRQVGMVSEKGTISLTLAGGEVLAGLGRHLVEIDDFIPAGNVFAVGVIEAGPEIRPGDEVVVSHAGEVRAVGTARMSGREMVDFSRGEAVRVRHHVRPKPS